MYHQIFDIKKENISDFDYNLLEAYFLSIHQTMTIANFTEVIDIHTGKYIRKPHQIKRILNSPTPIPFIFASCLN